MAPREVEQSHIELWVDPTQEVVFDILAPTQEIEEEEIIYYSASPPLEEIEEEQLAYAFQRASAYAEYESTVENCDMTNAFVEELRADRLSRDSEDDEALSDFYEIIRDYKRARRE